MALTDAGELDAKEYVSRPSLRRDIPIFERSMSIILIWPGLLQWPRLRFLVVSSEASRAGIGPELIPQIAADYIVP